MRFLVDNALSPVVAAGLRAEGHDAVHVRDYGMQRSSDDEIFDRAAHEQRVIVSADTDFGTIVARRGVTAPSVILFRQATPRAPRGQVRLLLANVLGLERDLEAGCIVVFDQARVRVRALPIGLPRAAAE